MSVFDGLAAPVRNEANQTAEVKAARGANAAIHAETDPGIHLAVQRTDGATGHDAAVQNVQLRRPGAVLEFGVAPYAVAPYGVPLRAAPRPACGREVFRGNHMEIRPVHCHGFAPGTVFSPER